MNSKIDEIANIAKKGTLWATRKGADATIAHLENYITAKQKQPKYPPIFIIGLSRSGTTLLYQLLCSHLKLSYFPNISAKVPSMPALTICTLRKFGICDSSPNYKSSYGITRGWNNPNTGASIWKRWFQKKNGEIITKCRDKFARQEMVGTISQITQTLNRPFINKWTPNSVRIVELANSFPDSLFLVVERNPVDIAQSILKARNAICRNPFLSFVTWPPQYESKVQDDYINNIVTHIKLVNAGMADGLNIIGQNRYTIITYKELCKHPKKIIKLVSRFYFTKTNVVLHKKSMKHVPDYFNYSSGVNVDSAEYNKIKSVLYKTW